MARPKMPIKVMQEIGKKHLTKKEIEERKKQEVKTTALKIKPPAYLTTLQKKEFKKYSKMLIEANIISDLDVDQLARYVIVQDDFNKLNKIMQEDEELLLDAGLVSIQDKKFKQCRDLAKDLGLNIAARCRINAPSQQQHEEVNPYDKFRR